MKKLNKYERGIIVQYENELFRLNNSRLGQEYNNIMFQLMELTPDLIEAKNNPEKIKRAANEKTKSVKRNK